LTDRSVYCYNGASHSDRGIVGGQNAEFEVETTVDGGVTVVAVRGEVDLDTASRLEEALRTAGDDAPGLIVDLSATSFFDSTGIHALLRAGSRAGAQGVRLFLVCSPAGIPRRVLEITGVERLYAVCDTLDDAKQLAAEAATPSSERVLANGFLPSLRRRPVSEPL
jgi:anti-sigma B factor antagonist